MEGFSQSRGDDDLFDDEFTPIEQPASLASAPVTSQLENPSLETNHNQNTSAPSIPHHARGRGRGRGNRAGRSNRENDRRGTAGLSDSKFATKSSDKTSTNNTAASQEGRSRPHPRQSKLPSETASARTATAQANRTASPKTEEVPEKEKQTSTETSQPAESESISSPPPLNAPTGPSRPPAVRGDRTATGGVRKPKLTEEELTAKLAAAKERSQEVAAAHARAQADAAEFEERERIATEKRQKDMVNRKALENEREKNRARKMAGQVGREWDAEKREEDFQSRRRGRGGGVMDSKYRNPEHVADNDLSMYEWHDNRGRGNSRGGRGYGRGGRGRGRGYGPDSGERTAPQETNGSRRRDLNVVAETDFPALPSSEKSGRIDPKTHSASSTIQRPETISRLSTGLLDDGGGGRKSGGGSWAEQVESSEAAKVDSAT